MRITERRLRRIIKSIIVEGDGGRLPYLDENEKKYLNRFIRKVIDSFFDVSANDLMSSHFLQDINDNRTQFKLGERRITTNVKDHIKSAQAFIVLKYQNAGLVWAPIINKVYNYRKEIFEEVEKEIKANFPNLGKGIYNKYTDEYHKTGRQPFKTHPYWGFSDSANKWAELRSKGKKEFCNRIIDNLYGVYKYDVIDS